MDTEVTSCLLTDLQLLMNLVTPVSMQLTAIFCYNRLISGLEHLMSKVTKYLTKYLVTPIYSNLT